jgi:hypothetical protein
MLVREHQRARGPRPPPPPSVRCPPVALPLRATAAAGCSTRHEITGGIRDRAAPMMHAGPPHQGSPGSA